MTMELPKLNLFTRLREVKNKCTTWSIADAEVVGRGVHESVFRASHALALVQDLLQRGYPTEFILEVLIEATTDEVFSEELATKAAAQIEKLVAELKIKKEIITQQEDTLVVTGDALRACKKI